MPHAIDHSLRLLLATAGDALWIWHPADGETNWGAAWHALLGLPADAALSPGADEWTSRLHPEEQAWVTRQFALLKAGDLEKLEAEFRLRTESGDYRWVQCQIGCERDARGKPVRYAGSFADISERKLLDPYTRLPNRILLLDRLERSLSRLRFGGSHAVGVLSIHIHLPASHAEQLSHEEQVQLARILGERITSELRPWDFVAQFDSLEYAALLEMVASGNDISTITERLFHTLRQPVQIGRHQLHVSASIGSADTATVNGNEERILRAAESAAQLATSQGHYHHVAYDPATQDQLNRHLQIERDIIAGLFEQAFEPWYQPIIRLTDNAVVGFEALARWPRDGEILEPRQFLPFMERSGLINQLTWVMLQKGLEQMAQWIKDDLLPADSRLGINLPADQLLEPQLGEQLLALIDETDAPARLIRLEIPEKIVLRQSPVARETLQQLRRNGIHVAIDDTGTGHSSLLQLQSFPLDTLKIDRQFVRNLEHDPAARGVVRTVIAIATSMQLGLIAKGVETPAQRSLLQEAGVELAQGFLFAAPMPASAIPSWLSNR